MVSEECGKVKIFDLQSNNVIATLHSFNEGPLVCSPLANTTDQTRMLIGQRLKTLYLEVFLARIIIYGP